MPSGSTAAPASSPPIPTAIAPFPGGRGEPDAAAIVAAIEACTGVRCEVNTGKPDPIMLETARLALGLDLADCVMIGDRLSTDIRMAQNAGMDSALVLTGETTPELLAQLGAAEQPTWVLAQIDHLVPVTYHEACGWAKIWGIDRAVHTPQASSKSAKNPVIMVRHRGHWQGIVARLYFAVGMWVANEQVVWQMMPRKGVT